MKKTGVLHHELADVIAAMGHTDMLVVADAGLPVPLGVQRIELAIAPGLPGILDVVRAIAAELEVEGLIVAEELGSRNPGLEQAFQEIFPGASLTRLPHEAFKERTKSARAVVRTGECTPYANVILCSGVTF